MNVKVTTMSDTGSLIGEIMYVHAKDVWHSAPSLRQ